MAVDYLKRQGYLILDRNVHAGRYGELDIVAQKDRLVVVAEVKYRRTNDHGDPLEAVSRTKQRRISRCTLYYLAKRGLGTDVQVRFDVIAVYGDERIRHVENAFEFQG
ncbi:MAG: YraN family protein [Lachnospiraceae bacterium]|nr:YraN family protein [Lachnospiraceae bacterium]